RTHPGERPRGVGQRRSVAPALLRHREPQAVPVRCRRSGPHERSGRSARDRRRPLLGVPPMTAGETVVQLRFAPNEDTTSTKVAAHSAVRDLIPGAEAVPLPIRFGSDIWNLGGHPGWRAKHGQQTKLDFTGVPTRWRTAAKEWTLLCLDPALALEWAPENPAAETWPEGQEPIKITTGQSNLKQLRLALV